MYWAWLEDLYGLIGWDTPYHNAWEGLDIEFDEDGELMTYPPPEFNIFDVMRKMAFAGSGISYNPRFHDYTWIPVDWGKYI
jgi:hypothetical protein